MTWHWIAEEGMFVVVCVNSNNNRVEKISPFVVVRVGQSARSMLLTQRKKERVNSGLMAHGVAHWIQTLNNRVLCLPVCFVCLH